MVNLGVDEADPNRFLLDVYKQHFEEPFIASTRTYYKCESDTFIGENTVTDYMKKAETRLKEEEDMVDMLLNPHSKKVVRINSFAKYVIFLTNGTHIFFFSWCLHAKMY